MMSMNRQAYVQRLLATRVTDDMTVGEAKRARRQVVALERFWRDATARHLLAAGEANVVILAASHRVVYTFDLRPTGSVLVEAVFEPAGWGDFGAFRQGPRVVGSWRVGKRLLLG